VNDVKCKVRVIVANLYWIVAYIYGSLYLPNMFQNVHKCETLHFYEPYSLFINWQYLTGAKLRLILLSQCELQL